MNTKLFSAMVLAAALLLPAGPAFALTNGGGGSNRVPMYSRAGGRFSGYSSSQTQTVSAVRTVAYGGTARPFGAAPAVFAFAAHPGWSHDRGYFWKGLYYRWYYDGWYLIQPYYAH